MTLDKSRPGAPDLGRALETESASPFPGLCDQLGHGCSSGHAQAGPAGHAPQHPGQPWMLGWGPAHRDRGCLAPSWGQRGTGCSAGQQRAGGGPEHPLHGVAPQPREQPRPPAPIPSGSSLGRPQRSGPDAAGPVPAPSPRCLLWPCCSRGPNMGCGNGRAGSRPGADPDGAEGCPGWPPSLGGSARGAGAERQSVPCRQHPAYLGGPQAPCSSASLSLCPSQPPSLPWTTPHPCLLLHPVPVCWCAQCHFAPPHPPQAAWSLQPCSPAVPQTSTAWLAPSWGRDTVPVLLTALQRNELSTGRETRGSPAPPALGILLPPGTWAGLAGSLRPGKLGSLLKERVCPAE